MNPADITEIIWVVLAVGIIITLFYDGPYARVCGSLLIIASLVVAVFIHLRGGPTP